MSSKNEEVRISKEWESLLYEEFAKPYFGELREKVRKAYMGGKVFPHPSRMFRAFDMCKPADVRVVILGQDPYHTPGVADGLAFSSFEKNPIPPSLHNIYKEIEAEFGEDFTILTEVDEIRGAGKAPKKAYSDTVTESQGPRNEEVRHFNKNRTPDLTRWAEQGVLLLNASLTVASGQANSHVAFGWHEFTDAVIGTISSRCEHVVFLLWGNYAREKRTLIDASKHLILESPHPSPLSAHKGFFGNGHFKKANEYLEKHGRAVITWSKD